MYNKKKFETLKKHGWKYDDGKIIKPNGKIFNKKFIFQTINKENYKLCVSQFTWFWNNGYTDKNINVIDKNKPLTQLDNLYVKIDVASESGLTYTEKSKILLEEGFKYDNGHIITPAGTVIKHNVLKINNSRHHFGISANKFAWYCIYPDKKIPTTIKKLDESDPSNFKKDNLTNRINTKNKPRTKRNNYPKGKETTVKFNSEKIYKNYINDDELFYNVLISKGKGSPIPELNKMFIKIATNLNRKFNYKNIQDREDCISEAILQLLENWEGFDEIKYDRALPYYTEVAKRAMAKSINQSMGKDKKGYVPHKFSLSEIYSL